jgi:ParB/RepB/Spo0J family partition protein
MFAPRNKKGRSTGGSAETAIATAGSASLQESDQVVEIALEKLHDHPRNPMPQQQEVLATVQWLTERGQDEPVVVRPLADPIGHFQVLAGRRRFAAATLLGWDTLKCRVRHDLADEAAAVEYMAASNAQRHTETPIRQALMLQAMIESGKSVTDAGRVYGLTSESAVRNKLQLLKLPDVWKARVVSGEIQESAARSLVPFVEYPSLMKAIDKEYRDDQKQEWRAAEWQTRDGFADNVENIVRNNTRPVEKSKDYTVDHRWHTVLFELKPELEEELQVVSLPLGENGKGERRAINVKKFDAIQQPLIDAKQKKSEGRSTNDPKPKKKQASPAQQKEDLEKNIAKWRRTWLCEIIAHKLGQVPNHWVLSKITLAIFTGEGCDVYWDQVMGEVLATKRKGVSDIVGLLNEANSTLDTIQKVIIAALLRHEQYSWPIWAPEFIEGIARDLGIDLAEEWQTLQFPRGVSDRLVAFWELHSGEQLDELGTELGVHLAGARGKPAKLQLLKAVDRTLRLPKSIAPLSAPKKKQGKKSHR